MQNSMDDHYYGPERSCGYQISGIKYTDDMWYIESGRFSLLVTDKFQHAIMTPLEGGLPRVRADTTDAPDVPEAQKAAILNTIAKWSKQ